ncbi:Rv3235 family protein [Trueperella pyogenes]|uniref:Rv3235 family protein n=1 Tax=Trueperella pyogenes TaxID=1661 RepID=UPI00043AC692|nr:Rv3235 family protein [Trueperella pyogenes]AHU90232.1 energy transducer TonB [Trueperella pyogenes]MDF2419813.1 Rv3235 family protein [Trueperella pyogenes]PIN51127.1 hypothetical protein CT171_08515 [Trueperella pyogenes]UVJ56188.1 Rv3235 family protein [Trueperella pyogenes]
MSQAAVLDRELATAKTPPLARPKYPHCKAQPLIAPALGQTQFDRAKFSSPKLDRPMYNGTTGGNDAACSTDTAPDRFAAAVVGQAIEVLMGHRPVRQLQTWLHPDVYDALARRAGLAQRVHGKAEKCRSPRVRRVRVCSPRAGIAEASLVVFDGKRIRAAAVRLEVRRGRWHVTALEII